MHVAAKSKILHEQLAQGNADLSRYVPDELAKLDDPQTAIPRIAKDAHSIRLIERATKSIEIPKASSATLKTTTSFSKN